jgi:sugar lactone lactonase YvrE
VVINIGGDMSEAGAVVRRSGRTIGGLIAGLALTCVILAVVSVILAGAGVFSSIAMVNQVVAQIFPPQAADRPNIVLPTEIGIFLPTSAVASPQPTALSFYELVLQFGAKGTGPGQFDDARYLAVDPDGNIFTAEYTDGRIQKFDPTGKFLALVNVPPDDQEYTTISDLAADYAGHIYVVRRGDILIFNALDGAQVGSIPGSFPDTWYQTVVVDPSNMLYAFHTSAGELDLIKMDATGKQVYRKPQVTEGLVKKTEISSVDKMAVDGLGNVYMLDSSQYQVYKFDKDGNFIDRFGGKGDGPGLLNNVQDLAVDGQGRVYVLNQDGIEIFDRNGVALKLIPGDYDGWAFDIQLDIQGNLYLITNAGQIYKYKVDLSE